MLALCFISGTTLSYAATEAQAKAVVDDYERAKKLWISEMKLAPDDDAKAMIMRKKPSATSQAKQLKSILARDLSQEWTLPYAAWLIESDPELTVQTQRILLTAVEKHHLKSPLVGRMCLAMIHLNDLGEMPAAGMPPLRSWGMKMLEKIKVENPHPKVQGQAALAISIMLSQMGENSTIMAQRIKNLREAIIKSADVIVGETSVAEIAEDELYKINNLSTGRQAPEIVGVDSSGRSMKLSDFRGKVVMLVFWSSWDEATARSFDILRETQNKRLAKPFVVLGVNRDSFSNLRNLEADGVVTWRNFSDSEQRIANIYRIASWPYCLVLDQAGAIRYRGSVGSFAEAVADDLMRN